MLLWLVGVIVGRAVRIERRALVVVRLLVLLASWMELCR